VIEGTGFPWGVASVLVHQISALKDSETVKYLKVDLMLYATIDQDVSELLNAAEGCPIHQVQSGTSWAFRSYYGAQRNSPTDVCQSTNIGPRSPAWHATVTNAPGQNKYLFPIPEIFLTKLI